MSRDWRAYAHHILDAIEKIRRNLQTLSEATQRLPDELKVPHRNIPWTQIGGFRNILVHNYLGNIDAMTVQTVVRDQLPPLEAAIRGMLSRSASDGD